MFSKIVSHIKRKISLTKEEEQLLESRLKLRTYLKNQYIVQEGDVYRFQSFINKGKIRTFYLDNNGHEHVVAFGLEDWWVGDICSFTTQEPAGTGDVLAIGLGTVVAPAGACPSDTFPKVSKAQ